VTWYRALKAYAAHTDRRAATGNTLALVIAANGPFYPLYAVAMIGAAGWPVFLTMLSSPFFAAVPRVMQRDTYAGRIVLLLVATLNSVWCAKLMGADTDVDLFLLPCAVLAALLFLREAWWLRLIALSFPVAAFILLRPIYGAALLTFSAADAARLVTLNRYSVGVLIGFLGWQFSRAA
jgi:hypothetical protein